MYNNQSVNAAWVVIGVYSHIHTEHKNALYVEYSNVQPGGT